MTVSSYHDILRMTYRLELSEQLQLMEALTRLVRQQIGKSEQRSILELEGLGAEIWQGADVQEYVDQERASWDS
jgi:hypothetical protein